MAVKGPRHPERQRRDELSPASRRRGTPAAPESDASARGPQRGHAFYADEARRALGIPTTEPRLADVPFPIIHAALGVAACAVAVALRPGAVGLLGSVIGVASLCAVTGAALAIYDRAVYPAQLRPTLESIALPVAARGAFSLVLAATVAIETRLVAAVVTVAVCGGLPHLAGLRASGREGWGARFLRDAAAIAVLAPVFLAAASNALPPGLRIAVTAVGVILVTLDGLQSEEIPRRHAWALALLTALVVTGALVGVARALSTPGVVAAVTLVIWYGTRGVAASTVYPPRRLSGALEHLAVVAIALGGVYLVAR
jgi:hypothetical protein